MTTHHTTASLRGKKQGLTNVARQELRKTIDEIDAYYKRISKLPKKQFHDLLVSDPSLSEYQQVCLHNWLLAREIDLASLKSSSIRKMDKLLVEEYFDEFAKKPYDEEIRVGQIRLFSPQILPNCTRPVTFSVVANWDKTDGDELKLIAPYGRYPEPAMPGEFRTGRPFEYSLCDPNFSVLCLWNSYTVPTDVLTKSWLIDVVKEDELDDAWEVWKHVSLGGELPTRLAERVGPQILSKFDPREAYQKEELDLLRPILKHFLSRYY
ncbi:MAG TPA: hypothetical protein VMR73_02005 [Candidatus Paceibacterota bacterium]|nr:hypothetical protein [Candidatus Paceibacterota bacterium]